MAYTPRKSSIIIPHWNGRQHLDTCLEALLRQTYTNHEIILVDNGSTDGSQDFVRNYYPQVILVELPSNLGFTGACNAGYRLARGEFILLLNNDTEVEPEWLSEVIAAFDRHPEVGIVACKILLFDRRDYFHSAGDYYRVNGLPGNRGVWQQDVGQFDREELVFGACGAAAGFRRTMIEDIGFLDDSFYFSCEDVDMSWRAHLAGWQVLYAPSAVVYHKLKATGGNITASYYDGRNFLYILWKDYPTALFRRHWQAILKAQLTITWEALRSWRGAAARARVRGQLAGLAGLFRMLPKRKLVQANKRTPDESMTAVLSLVDETI